MDRIEKLNKFMAENGYNIDDLLCSDIGVTWFKDLMIRIRRQERKKFFNRANMLTQYYAPYLIVSYNIKEDIKRNFKIEPRLLPFIIALSVIYTENKHPYTYINEIYSYTNTSKGVVYKYIDLLIRQEYLFPSNWEEIPNDYRFKINPKIRTLKININKLDKLGAYIANRFPQYYNLLFDKTNERKKLVKKRVKKNKL